MAAKRLDNLGGIRAAIRQIADQLGDNLKLRERLAEQVAINRRLIAEREWFQEQLAEDAENAYKPPDYEEPCLHDAFSHRYEAGRWVQVCVDCGEEFSNDE